MEIPSALRQKIVDFLLSIPNINDNKSQQALIYDAGLDRRLQFQINFGGSSIQFFQLLVSTLIQYGTLKNGRNALEAVLDSAKNYIGQDRRSYCNKLIQEFREALYEEHPQSMTPEAYRQKLRRDLLKILEKNDSLYKLSIQKSLRKTIPRKSWPQLEENEADTDLMHANLISLYDAANEEWVLDKFIDEASRYMSHQQQSEIATIFDATEYKGFKAKALRSVPVNKALKAVSEAHSSA